MAVRMKDIAAELGLSVVTVSKVLRNHPDISEETRKRVLKRMKELDYQPNFAARSLITGHSWSIGLVVPDLLHPFFAQIAKAISAEIRARGYCLLISSSDENPQVEEQEIRQLVARRVDVLLIASARSSPANFKFLDGQEVPYILLDRHIDGLKANFIGVNDVEVGLIATRHLIEQGCRRIAHIRGPEVSTARGRLEGYRRALAEFKGGPLPEQVVSLGSSGDHRGEKGGYTAAMELLKAKTRPDAIFCFNDPSALGAIRAIDEAGLRIPDDIAVVGCGNVPYDDMLRVPLTSVDQGSEDIGKVAATLALKLAGSKSQPAPRPHLITPHIVARASSLRKRP
ncbi:MAG: LacI family DNA-binding transcriptional regulator [Terracidiphilus sp.]